MNKSSIRLGCTLILLSALLALSGCASMLPDHKLDMEINAAHNINPDNSNRPSPIVLKVYQLKSADIFNNADFFSLYYNGTKVLGKDLVMVKTLEVIPGKQQEYQVPLADSVKYLGVIAAYHQINKATWRQTIELASTWGSEDITIHVRQLGLSTDY